MEDKKIKMVALDLDGTALDKNSQITDRTRKVLQMAMKHGVHIVVSTGRSFDAIPEAVFDVEGIEYVINSNGADITEVSSKQCIYANHIEEKTVLAAIELLQESGLSVEAVIDRITYIDKAEYDDIVKHGSDYRDIDYVISTRTPVENLFGYMMEHKGKIENINIIFRTLEEKEKWRKKLVNIPDSTLTTSFTHNYEIGGKTTSKAEALRFLMKKLDISRDELMACGDSPNDEEMIKLAGLGVAMGNATESVKEMADYITDTNSNDGVARAIEKFVLK